VTLSGTSDSCCPEINLKKLYHATVIILLPEMPHFQDFYVW
jgi:hypothetical protein